MRKKKERKKEKLPPSPRVPLRRHVSQKSRGLQGLARGYYYVSCRYSTREKLLDILRSKVIGEKDEETIDQGSIKVKRARSVSSDEEDELDGPARQQEDEDDDGDVDGDKGTTFTEKIDRFAVENGGKLSGPVTDL
ncbi:uncharacterized protein LOC143361098 [Halictus rubicundus]|uniref:uncharacterized protein LOC143361098 n=1 Tax=Halictus rubicundus TaxID=77578 RepID=UPI004036B2BA